MKKVMVPGVREVYYSRLQEDCGINKRKEVYRKVLVQADTHDEAIAFFMEHIVDDSVVQVLTSGAVYVHVRDDEMDQLEWI